jgi:2,4-dienoyl-CoA reductase-like NADH-dependent reductase (Old Yellow Enzyme family)/thioredoxin reductase
MSAKLETKWKLLEPVKIGPLTIKNRIMLPAMFTRLATADGVVTQKLMDYYAERARGSMGVIVVEFSDGVKGGRGRWDEIGLNDERFVPGLKELSQAIKSNGAAAFIQICHAGRQKVPELTDIQLVAPSRLVHSHSECGKYYHRMPKALTVPEIKQIEEGFAEAADRARRAGFDGIELHGAHGYLLCDFVSPYVNRRTDEYGGPLENRARFPLEIIRKIRAKIGPGLVIGYKMNGDDFIPKGLSPDEAMRFARMLEEAGVDYITVSAAMEPRVDFFIQPTYIAGGSLVYLAGRIKSSVKVPVVAVGSLNVELAEKALREGQADLVALGRASLADPDIAAKLSSGRTEDIRPCIRGNEDCMNMIDVVKCEVNPACGREAEFRITPAKTPKKVLVVGGGIAGMEAARVAFLRGHSVTLLEKSGSLGGHLIEASVPNFKDGLKQLLAWSKNQVSKNGVKVQLNTEVNPALVRRIKPDVLIIAAGSDYAWPPVEGLDKAGAVTPADILSGNKPVGEKIVVLGGGLVGSETALYIAEKYERPVSIVEMLKELLCEANFTAKAALEDTLNESGVDVYLNWQAEKASPGHLICRDNQGQKHDLEADTIVVATGLVERGSLVEKLQGLAPEVYAVGDCLKASNVSNAMESAWEAVFKF